MFLSSAVARATLSGAIVLTFASLSASAHARTTHTQVLTRGLVAFPESGAYPTGAIIISQSQRRIYLNQGNGTALTYPVAIGKTGKAWSGWSRVSGKYVSPAWSPPAVVKHDNPRIPDVIPGGAPGNPMGARALTLDLDEIAIHGTSNKMRASIGTAASYGCIRMLNEDVIDLFDRVSVGTPVVAVR